MATTCVEKLSHPACGSVDSLQVFEEDGKFTGYCFNCSTYIPNPYEDKPPDYQPVFIKKTPEMVAQEMKEIESCPVLDLPSRKLRKESLDYFGVKIGVSETDGKTPALHYYPYYKNNKLTGYKVRLIENKRMWSVGDVRGVDLFGWQQAIASGAKRLLIVEGELDAVALFQMLKDKNRGTKYEVFNHAVVSIPHGAATAVKDLMAMMPKIKRHFKEWVFIPDKDQAGDTAKEAVAKAIPTMMFATLPCKDANDCLIEGRSVAACNAVLFQTNKPKNTRFKYGSELREAAKKKPTLGLSWPWEHLTRATRGIRRGETYYFGAGVKMGKSELVNALASHMITEHGKTVLLVKPEEAVAKTYQMLVGKVAGRIFHDPNTAFDEEAFDAADALVGDKAMILDSYQFVDWETLKADIEYAVLHEGVEDVFLDPITCFTNQMKTSEANEFLVKMSAELSQLAKDHQFTAYIFCHLKAPTDGTPHERGGKVLSTQFAGSRAMMRRFCACKTH